MSIRGAKEDDHRRRWDVRHQHGVTSYDAYFFHRLRQPIGRISGRKAQQVWDLISEQEIWISEGLSPAGTRMTRLSPLQLERFGSRIQALLLETSPVARRHHPELGERALLLELVARFPRDTFFQVFARAMVW